MYQSPRIFSRNDQLDPKLIPVALEPIVCCSMVISAKLVLVFRVLGQTVRGCVINVVDFSLFLPKTEGLHVQKMSEIMNRHNHETFVVGLLHFSVDCLKILFKMKKTFPIVLRCTNQHSSLAKIHTAPSFTS